MTRSVASGGCAADAWAGMAKPFYRVREPPWRLGFALAMLLYLARTSRGNSHGVGDVRRTCGGGTRVVVFSLSSRFRQKVTGLLAALIGPSVEFRLSARRIGQKRRSVTQSARLITS